MLTHQTPQYNIDWPGLYFKAECDNEPFSKMRIVTAKSEFQSKVKEMALDMLVADETRITTHEINRISCAIIQKQIVTIFEYARVDGDDVIVCIDADLKEESTNFKALNMVYEAINNGGYWKSDEALVYGIEDFLISC
jgi:hypothetical protein